MSILSTTPNAIGVAIHNSDGMDFTAGNTVNSAFISGFPSGLVDRYKFESSSSVELDRGQWQTKADERLQYIVPASVTLTNSYNPTTKALSVEVTATFYADAVGDIRLNCYIVEDSVTGTGADYNQVNYYDAEAGHPMYGLGDPIMNYKHRHVLRDLLGGAWGTYGSIPSSVTGGSTYTKTYTKTFPTTWNYSRVKLVAVIQKYNSNDEKREIINASEHSLNIVTDVEKVSSIINYSIYPNPTNNFINLNFNLNNSKNISVSIVNSLGQEVYNNTDNYYSGFNYLEIDCKNWSKGIYLIQINDGNIINTEKVIIN